MSARSIAKQGEDTEEERRAHGPRARYEGEFALVRTPLLPYARGGVPLVHGLEHAGEPVVREALLLASQRVVREFEEASRSSGRSLEFRAKLEQTVLRYLSRMSARPTPFGTFAGFTVVPLGERTRIELAPVGHYRRRTTLDRTVMDVIARAALATLPRAEVRVTRASSLVDRGDHWIFLSGGQTDVVRAQSEEPLRLVLSALPDGRWLSQRDLVAALTTCIQDVTEDEAYAFVEEMRSAGMLVDEGRLPLVGERADVTLNRLVDRCSASMGAALRGLLGILAQLDEEPLGALSRSFSEVAQRVEALAPECRGGDILHCELFKPLACGQVDRAQTERVARVALLLSSAAAEHPMLVAFRERLQARHDTREVRLVDLLDEEVGVEVEGECDSDDLAQDPMPPPANGRLLRSTVLGDLVARRLTRSTLQDGEIVLSRADVESRVRRRDPPPALCVSYTLTGSPPRPILRAASVPTALGTIGRFACRDAALERALHVFATREARLLAPAVPAEIVYDPPGRVRNILHRPSPYRAEIRCGGRGADRDVTAFLASDLLVSARDGGFVLRSSSTGQRVVPRLTNAHRFDTGRMPRIYKFLCLLQYQGFGPPVVDLGPLQALGYVPRLVLDGVVIRRATWRVSRADLFSGASGVSSEADAVERSRRELGVADRVCITQEDQEYVVDLRTPEGRCAVAAHARAKSVCELVEFLEPSSATVTGPEGTYAHEIVVPLHLAVDPERGTAGGAYAGGAPMRGSPPEVPARAAPLVRSRRFLPGSPWVYVKLYCSQRHADGFLGRSMAGLVAAARRAGVRDWFFVRYADPEWHVRLRLAAPQALAAKIQQLIVDHFAADRGVWRIQVDTYEREIERYGGFASIEDVERIFCADSDAALRLLALGLGSETRWRAATKLLLRLLEDAGLPDVPSALRSWRDGLEGEAAHPPTVRRAARSRYDRLLSEGLPPVVEETVRLAAADRTAATRAEWSRVSACLAGDGYLDVVASVAHMSCNRLFRAAARRQEAMAYDAVLRMLLSRAHGVAPDAR